MSEIGHTVPLLSLLNVSIKTPQLIGIVVGCLVFTITIITVFALLYASGSLSKLAEELSNTHPTSKQNSTKIVSGIPFSSEPELYEELLFARTKLPTMPSISLLLGRVVNIKTYDQSALCEVLQISDGRAVFHESSFDPARITGWLDTERCTPTRSIVDLLQCDPEKKTHLCIVDKELNKIVGMLSLVDNCPRNLSIRIGKRF